MSWDTLTACAFEMAHYLCASPADAKDVAQTALLKLWLAEDSVEKPRAWLQVVIRHLVIETAMKARTLQPTLEPHTDPERGLVLDIFARDLLGQLPSRQRIAVTLRAEGFHQREIALALDISPAAVESLLARGRRTLRKLRGR